MLPSLREIRKRWVQLGITQDKLAKELRIGQSTIAKIERGNTNPSFSLAEKIFSYLNSYSSAKLGAAREVATKRVVSVAESDTVQKAVRILQRHGFKQVPVLRGGQCVGSVSERTVSQWLLDGRNPRALLGRRVSKIMDDAFPAVPKDTPVSSIVGLLRSAQATVTVGEDERTGAITNADLLKLTPKLA